MTAASALLSHWIAHLRDERRFAANSIEAYERDVSAFLDFLQSHLGGEPDARALAELEPRDLRAYLAYRRQGPDALGDRSISRALAAIRSFYRYLERRHGVTNARLSLVRGPKLKRPLPRPVSEAAARDLISEAQSAAGEEWIGARDAALVTLLYASGLRISEASAAGGGVLRGTLPVCADRGRTAFSRGSRRRYVSAHGSSADADAARPFGIAFERHATRFAACVRNTFARERRRSQSDSRPARTRVAVDDSDLYERRSAKNFAVVSPRTSARVTIFVHARTLARLCFQGV
jgi:site-specific recombinase XerC